jgi:integrase
MPRASKSWHPATKRTVDALKPRTVQPGQATASAIYDVYFAPPAPKGMHVRVFPNGRKVFCLRYRDPSGGTPARYRRVDLGEYGTELTVDQAVKAAADARQRVAAGEAPHTDKAERAKAPTVSQLLSDYLTEVRRIRKPRTAAEYERMLKREIGERFGRELVTAITPRHMQQLHAEITDKGKLVNANRLIAYASPMFAYAIRRGDLTSNPAAAVKLTPEEGRDVEPLNNAQAAALGKALDDAEAAGEAWQAVAIVRLLFLTGCRRSEVERMQWGEIDWDAARLVLIDSKGTKRGKRRTDRRVLGADVLELLRAIETRHKAMKVVSPYVFPRDEDTGRWYGNLDRVWHRLREAAGMPALHLHDLRHDVQSDYAARYPKAITKFMTGKRTENVLDSYEHDIGDPHTRAADERTSDRIRRLQDRSALAEDVTPIDSKRRKRA